MKFLFLMHYPGYLRYFDSTVRGLATRGHAVELLFDSPHKQPEGIEALANAPACIECLGRSPTRGDVWGPVSRAVRGAIDYTRYLDPSFVDAPYLRRRMRAVLKPPFRFLGRFDTLGDRTARRVVSGMLNLERAIPSSPQIEHFLRKRRPDALIVSPLVTDQSPQVDWIKSAQAIGLPAALCVASWDHLTTKGLMRIRPDLVAVWNETQRDEAVRYHDMASDDIVVTGAQPFDRWFDREPSLDREAFCRKVGLRADVPFVLFVGSTASISAPDAEIQFVRRWASMVRRRVVGTVGDIGVLVRPHPFNCAHWRDADLSDLQNVAVYPADGANPVDEGDRADYFDSLFHSAVVVGVNTSAMIEAAVVGRPVHTILAREFEETQQGTLHFRYLLPENGGFLRVATNLDEHIDQLKATLAVPERDRERLERFVRTFVRPYGAGAANTSRLVAALEMLASRAPCPGVRMSPAYYPLRLLLWTIGCLAVYRGDPDRRRRALRKAMKRGRQQVEQYLRHRRKRRAASLASSRDAGAGRRRVVALRGFASAKRKALWRLLVQR